MNDSKLSSTGLGALAVLVAHLRDDWQPPGIRTALDAAAARPVTGYDLAHAALRAAANPAVRTPAVIALDGQHWQASPPAERPTPGPRQFPRCQRCRFEVTEGHADHAEHCGRPRLGIPEPARQAALTGIRRAAAKRRAPTPPKPHSGSHGESEGS